MWRTFVFENTNYVLKIKLCDNYRMLLTDLTNIWVEELTKEQICERCNDLNPLISTDNDTFLNTTIALLTDLDCEVEYNLTKSEDKIILECKSQMDEIYFKFRVDFNLSNEKTYFEEFTKSLINTIQFLENHQEKLCDVIESKNIEIAQHKYENGEINCKKNLITKKFKKEDIQMPKHLCCGIFSNPETFTIKDDLKEVKKEEEVKPEEKKQKILTLAHRIMMKRKRKHRN